MKSRTGPDLLWGLVLLVVAGKLHGDVIMPVLKSPKPYPDVDMPYISPKQMEDAFATADTKAQQRSKLENQLPSQRGTIARGSKSAEARHQKFVAIDPDTVNIDQNQEMFEQASKQLVTKFGLTKEQAAYGLGQIDMPHGSNRARKCQQDCQRMFSTGSCNPNSKFRNQDGSCNNLDNPSWGMASTCFARLMGPDYEDGLSAPRVAQDGNPLPNARFISTFVHDDLDVPANSYTIMTMQFGQFMDHDMTLTPMTRAGPSMNMIECCQNQGPQHPECFQIEIPPDDDFFAPRRQSCFNFVRSASCSSGCKLGPREQTNQLTAFIDASNIYGSDTNATRSLREFRGGRMRSQFTRREELLPPSLDPENDQCSRQDATCFEAGDGRVNEQPALTSMHTIWLRQHNRIARYLQQTHSSASDEDIFQETKRIVAAQLQQITYGEFLPVVLGPAYMKYFNLYPLNSGFTDYDTNTQPSIVQAFAGAAYRFGHTIIDNLLHQYDANGNNIKDLTLADNFFFPFTLFNGELDPIIRGLFLSPAQQYDRHLVESVSNHLYKAREDPFGMDLAALNLQRGRDHGIRGYTAYIDYCFDIKITRFSDLQRFMTQQNWQRLQRVYTSVDDIDLFTGGVSEDPMDDAVVGPTFGCIIGLQFFHLKFGDRFFYEHRNQAGSFTPNQLNEIRNTKFARVLCANTNVKQISVNVFRPTNNYVSCDNLHELNLDWW